MVILDPTGEYSYLLPYIEKKHYTIGGAIERAMNFADKVTLLSENGAKTVLVPIENMNKMQTIPQSIYGKTDVPFYGNSQMLLQKAVFGE